MNTPICNFLQNYNFERFHMPSHNGHSTNFLRNNSIEQFDITEVNGADDLFNSDGIILQSEENLSSLYQTKFSCYSCGGSTLAIQTMLACSLNLGDTVIAPRNVHRAFINTCALLDLNPVFIQGDSCTNLISYQFTLEQLQHTINANPQAKAVYLTSPDYLGIVQDISSISKICKKHNLLLIVDNAHGAHLKFCPNDIHPISLGADICCDSAHKTLGVLTGGAYVHVSQTTNHPYTKDSLKRSMSIFGSSSPSYLILASLDNNNVFLDTRAKLEYARLSDIATRLQSVAEQRGILIANDDFTKLVLYSDTFDITTLLRQNNIEPEMSSNGIVVLMLSPFHTQQQLHSLENLLKSIPVQQMNLPESFTPTCEKSISIRNATFCASNVIPIEDCIDKITSNTIYNCPPAIPLIVAGEKINKQTQLFLKKCGILFLNVIE